MLTMRNEKRYGCFSAECDELGKVTVDVSPYGFGELITICRNGEIVAEADTSKPETEAFYEEDDDFLTIGEYRIRKPYGKCLRRY